jgi:uncharacterized membrane protein
MSWAAFVLKEDRAASKSSLLLLGTIAMIQVANLIAVSYRWPSVLISDEPISRLVIVIVLHRSVNAVFFYRIVQYFTDVREEHCWNTP